MKCQCVNCGEIFDEDKVILAGVGTGFGFGTSTIYCNDCFEIHQKSKKSCTECKYRKTKRKNEPCKSCKGHINWEEKPLV